MNLAALTFAPTEYVVLKNTLGIQFGATCGLVWFLLRPQPYLL